MAVKVQQNSREFSLSWEEFEKAFYCVEGRKEADDIELLKQAGNC